MFFHKKSIFNKQKIAWNKNEISNDLSHLNKTLCPGYNRGNCVEHFIYAVLTQIQTEEVIEMSKLSKKRSYIDV